MTHMTPIVKLNLKLQKLKSSLCDYLQMEIKQSQIQEQQQTQT